jgi:hypothetical protein
MMRNAITRHLRTGLLGLFAPPAAQADEPPPVPDLAEAMPKPGQEVGSRSQDFSFEIVACNGAGRYALSVPASSSSTGSASSVRLDHDHQTTA